ncbi:hypothetical protein B0G76_1311 [Paraburkholderia sp. BL23I1N1]|uniref:hypothetical protein n=1 Tax=Paraburkholderia sp. BL23I1N1 TaxID=1938802 RepID=UPI000E7547A8|nr:hypothetical protein [Paraburkholderia sp. BL23I1N1]RKE35250.1 hypothetical protein B0G76_1311 [Paraburkholderia sp. BL23I1N1]
MATNDYVGVHGGSNIVFVLVADRRKFDNIPLSVREANKRAAGGGHLLVKSMHGKDAQEGSNRISVIFQHWIVSPDLDRLGSKEGA